MKKILFSLLFLSLGLILVGCDMLSTSEDGPFIVAFETSGGSTIESIEVEEDGLLVPSLLPSKDGYIFKGWYLDSSFNYPFAFNAGIRESLTLYAKWESETESLDTIRDLLNEMLDDDNLTIADQEMIESMLITLIEEGGLINEEAIIDTILENIDIVALYEKHITDTIELARQSTVMVETYSGGAIDGGGSGVIYKKVGNTYYVLTNEHVVNGYTSNNISITLFTPQGERLISRGNVTLKGTTVLHDMAVLTFTSLDDFRVMPFGTKASLNVGQTVFAIGSPLDLPNTVTQGVLSFIDREMWDDYGMDTMTIQHTAAINPGNSGGALIDIYGHFIGLNTMSYVDEYVGEGITDLNFAIQIDVIMRELPSLEN